MRGWAMFLSGALLAAAGGAASASSLHAARLVSLQDAAALVRADVEYQIRHINPGGSFSLDKNAEPDPNYYSFQALAVWHPEKEGSAVLGNYAVDRRTAEVWNDDNCEEAHFPALTALQTGIRKRIGLSRRAYLALEKHRNTPPHC